MQPREFIVLGTGSNLRQAMGLGTRRASLAHPEGRGRLIRFAFVRAIGGQNNQSKNLPCAMTCSSSSQMSKFRPTQSMWVVLFQGWPVCSE